MILVSGPTGAGKTTTLYASLNSLNQTEQNIITIEDPIEYQFKNINQIQVNPRSGITFPSGLRSILRLDPDVILVGEIRDAETAAIAVQSALTGHMVLSTIHANDSASVIYRLIDLGVEPFLLSSAIIGVVAQRMVRQVCPKCGRPVKPTAVEAAAYKKETGETLKKYQQGSGCDHCDNTGYSGRCPLFEILPVSDEMRRLLISGSSTEEMRHQAIAEGMVTLAQDGMLKVKNGITTPSEVLRNAYTTE
jgi:type II secretory ATPase GspE/PulE/Tfp pilus assembly ATPase PilB-like protein